MNIIYEIMHMERIVANICTNGTSRIYDREFLPYNLYLDDTAADFDTLFENLSNFYFWCSSRMLTLDRVYAKEILNSIGAVQPYTDRERAQIALSYHCLCLTDVFWVRKKGEKIRFQDINLYENHLSNAFIDISLKGKQATVENPHLIADDISTGGAFPKAWIRRDSGFYLLKDGNAEAVEKELLASRIARCFSCRQVYYEEGIYDGTVVSQSRIMTSLEYSIVSREAFEIYAVNHDINALEYILSLDGYSYHMMNILDYLIGNTDRHWGNWGLLIDNRTNRPIRLHDLMDFNYAFSNYDTIDGANCLTGNWKTAQTQLQAAAEGVKAVGLNQVRDISPEWFGGNCERAEMFWKRLEKLKAIKKE